MLFQAGSLLFRTGEGAASQILYTRPSSVNIASAVEIIEARGFPIGDAASTIQILDSAIVSETFTLTLAQESSNNTDLQIALDAREQVVASGVLPLTKVVTVPAIGPFTVTLTELTSAAADQDISIVALDENSPLPLTRVPAAGTPTAGQFTSGAAKLLTFNAAQAGKSVLVYFFETRTAFKQIGGAALRRQLGNLEFFGILKSTRWTKRVWAPSVSRVSGSSLGVTGSVEANSLEYRINTPTGYNFPFLMWDLT